MQKVFAVLLILVVSTLGLWASGSNESSASGQQVTVFRAGIINPDGHPLVEAVRDFGKILEEKSEGRFKIDLYSGGQLGDHKTNITSLQTGALDMYMIMGGLLVDYGVEKLSVMMLPYIFDNVDHARAVHRSPIGQEVLDSIQQAGTRLVGLGMYQESSRHFFFTDKAVDSIAEMQGLKIRVQPGLIYETLLTAFGASVVPVAFGELYSALQTGVVDGGEQPLSGYYANRLHEVAPYYLLDGHETSPNYVLFSELTWNKLSAEDQALIREAFAESVENFNSSAAATDAEIMEKLLEEGVTVIEPSYPQEWKDVAASLYETIAPKYADMIQAIKNTAY